MTSKLPPLKWTASPNFSERTAHLDLIVIHDCEGGYAGSIKTFQGAGGANGPVSAHFVLREDGGEATQMVPLSKKAWHCRAFNSRSIGIEMAGFEKKGFAPTEWGAAEAMTAWLCHKYGIPVRWAQGGVGPGIARHFDLGRAGGGHMDPTLDAAVWQNFLTGVQAEVVAGTPLAKWSVRA